MAIGPSGGMLKKLFNPAMMKKKMKAAGGKAPAGGPKIMNKTDVGGKKPSMKLMNAKGM